MDNLDEFRKPMEKMVSHLRGLWQRIDSSGREPLLHQQEEEEGFHNGEEKLPDVDVRLSQKPGTSPWIGFKERWSVFRRFLLSVEVGKEWGGNRAAGSETGLIGMKEVINGMSKSLLIAFTDHDHFAELPVVWCSSGE